MMKTLATKAMLAAGAATVAISAVSAPAEALTVSPNRGSWESAISGLTNPAANPIVTETFSNSVPGAVPFGPATTPSGIAVSSSGFGSIVAGLFGTSLGDPNTATFGLPTGSLGFAVDITNNTDNVVNPTITWTALDASGVSIGTGSFDISGTSSNFFGIFQNTPGGSLISSVQFSKLTEPGIVVGYDDASFATPVPTPALLPGLIGMGVAALRKRNGTADEAEA